MSNQQIAATLKSKGFNVKATKSGVVVSLNRQINTMEVNAALGFDIPAGFIFRTGKSVLVTGYDS